ncbi:Aldo/keto reductase [Dissoconium aciculare CBS 342.82]|uniref:Aldo/keto reductase n=1 Tax=Dissoconium aciculare CBS 342.82 TaxID=1314786 RepID=A0A6J3M859_9PEZI|nr:Aldo/keto reductase [Dissoconium aciculare CBS 342.82]KAF1824053.1 Aldo/keto reductase [Dissoconium aciculare CBS 342.82]
MAALTPASKKSKVPLSDLLPPLIFGTATFNYQYNPDPYELDPTGLVQQALEYKIRAFDTSPYYGPSEEILGASLDTPWVHANVRREEYFLLTKCGRISSDHFDYRPASIAASVRRSLVRLRTTYLDVVYCHDVEFVSSDSVVAAVRELRRLRDTEGIVKYVGISGYPVPVLVALATRILAETGEPLDAVMSYANFTLQNGALGSAETLAAFAAAKVDVVPNASPLGMGLLRREGIPLGSLGDWHPAPYDLRAAVARASDLCDVHGEQLEVIALRWALEEWLARGAPVGSRGDPAAGTTPVAATPTPTSEKSPRLGVSVMGVSKAAELRKTVEVWHSILEGHAGSNIGTANDLESSLTRRQVVQKLASEVQERLGKEWLDYAWDSPTKGAKVVSEGETDETANQA